MYHSSKYDDQEHYAHTEKIFIERMISLRKPEEKKTIRKTVLMTEALSADIDQEARKRGIKANTVMNERLQHRSTDNSPAKVTQFQDYANEAVKLMMKYSEKDAKILERKANKLWKF